MDQVQTTCGWGVPQMTLERERPTLAKAHAQRSPEELLAITASRDRSIDGLPVRVPTRVPPVTTRANVAAVVGKSP